MKIGKAVTILEIMILIAIMALLAMLIVSSLRVRKAPAPVNETGAVNQVK